MSVVLAFDFGLKRTGLAIGNTLTGIATPCATIIHRNKQDDWDAISQLIKEWKPNALVVGLPRHLDGSESEMTLAAKRFSNRLHGRYGLPVYNVDEQLSSQEAEQRLKQSRQRGRKKAIKKTDIDQLAACIILESWFMQKDES